MSNSVGRTMAIGRCVGRRARPGDVIALCGELGAGKTQFARGVAAGLGLDPAHVSSPTFVMVQEYVPAGQGAALIHIDAYRVDDRDDLDSIGWDRSDPELRQSAVVVIEWADRIAEQLEGDVLEVRLAHAGDHERDITLRPRGRWVEAFGELTQALTNDEEMQMADDNHGKSAKSGGRCPTCGKTVAAKEKSFPFCSERCRVIDLGKWADEKYVISRPIEHSDLDEE